ncbi:MAG: DUF1028 domain-containing protein [Thermoproteota archaeon]
MLRPLSTYSIVAIDKKNGVMGVAVQSHWFSVGSIVAWAEPGVGVVATQSVVEVSYGQLGLALMRGGLSAEQALKALLSVDPFPEVRQVAMLLYIVFRSLRRGRHRYFGLRICLRKVFALVFLFPLLHAGSLPLLSIFCFTQSLSLPSNNLFSLVAAHLMGVALSIFALSTLTYMIDVKLLRRVWINFEKVWLAALVSTAIFLILARL